jgi:hypothetical protein
LKVLGAAVLLAGWVLMAPDTRGSFGSEAACWAEASAWAARTQESANWTARRYQEALQQRDPAVSAFWSKSERMAAGQIAQAKAARCMEVK